VYLPGKNYFAFFSLSGKNLPTLRGTKGKLHNTSYGGILSTKLMNRRHIILSHQKCAKTNIWQSGIKKNFRGYMPDAYFESVPGNCTNRLNEYSWAHDSQQRLGSGWAFQVTWRSLFIVGFLLNLFVKFNFALIWRNSCRRCLQITSTVCRSMLLMATNSIKLCFTSICAAWKVRLTSGPKIRPGC